MSWHVGRFISGTEMAAARRANGTARAFCPVYRRRSVVRGSIRSLLAPVLPGNVFVEMELGFHAYRYHELAGFRGFLGFIGGGFAPQRVNDVEATHLLAGMRGRVPGAAEHDDADWEIELDDPPETAPRLSVGDLVRLPVSDGLGVRPIGVVRYLQSATVARVSCTWLFGREHVIPVDVQALEKVAVEGKTHRRNLMTLEPRASF